MKNMRKFIKQNIKGFIVGLIVTGVGIVTASTIMPSNSVTYNNSSQNVTNVKEALDVLLEKADNEAPTVSVSVSGKTATFTLKDDLGVIGYQVTTSTAEPTSWISITSTTSIVKTWTASSAGTYYVHVKDKFGKTNKVSFVIEQGAFSYPHYVLQDGVVLDENMIEYVRTTKAELRKGGGQQGVLDTGTYNLFQLKNADEYTKITVGYKIMYYSNYGDFNIYINGKSLASGSYQGQEGTGWDTYVKRTIEVDTKTCTGRVYVNNRSSGSTWWVLAGLQLVDIYVEP